VSGPRVRFAPSPTGSLHLGNARTALFNWLVARGRGGRFLLRIEDTDTAREQEGSEASILDDLRWLGLTWDETPVKQSERLDDYRAAAARLEASGSAFRCFCPSRGDDEARAAGHRDPCRKVPREQAARRAAAGEAHAHRLRIPDVDPVDGASVRFVDRLRGEIVIPLAQLPDAVILRHDHRPTYNFAAAVDDAAMAIDLVIRGDDHLTNTAVQVLLDRALALPIPAFAHLPMVLGPDGERLSKRHGAASVGSWRERGVPAEALVNALALLGWAPPGDVTIVSRDDLVATFDLDRVGRAAAVFDAAKLEWISAQHVRALAPARLTAEVAARLAAAGRIDPAEASDPWIGELAELLRPTLATFGEVTVQAEPVFHAGGPLDEEAGRALEGEQPRAILRGLSEAFEQAGHVDAAAWSSIRSELQSATGARGRALFEPLRVALTGRAHGREMDRLVPLMDAGHRALPARVPSLRSRVLRTLEGLR
jgi:nondiscriminating glutamyl-tRNA synthetase